jgi:drug/metabolite transporter (DMT)-like permease
VIEPQARRDHFLAVLARSCWHHSFIMMAIVLAMFVVLAIAVSVMVVVLVGMKGRYWRWPPNVIRWAKQAAQLLNNEASGLPR